MKKYLYFDNNLVIKEYPSSQIVLFVKGSKYYDTQKKDLIINKTAEQIIAQIDGTKTLEDLINYFVVLYDEDYKSISDKVITFMEEFQSTHNILIKTSSDKRNSPVRIIKDAIHYPIVASLEITDKCNLKCLHCYGDFDISNSNTLSLADTKKILSDLRNIGVDGIEITGGECTIHPNFEEILLSAVEIGFKTIAILTNGIALNSKIIKIINEHKSRFLIQVDLQSLNDDYLHWFTNKKHTLQIIKNNIISLANNDIKMRVVTTVTHKNVHELINIAEWLYANGIKSYALTIAASLGRASDNDSDLYLNEEDTYIFDEQINEINDRFDKLLFKNPPSQTHKNCGCITNHVTINSLGDIKLCTMDNLSYIDSSIGNVLKTNIKEIYDTNKEFISEFYNLVPPDITSENCIDCKEKVFCHGCLNRAFIKTNELKDKCGWYKNILTPKLKKQFKI